ncbi:MAG: tetratricopeptide repeat-containing protein, partial [Deltaproteobacteria bacterium]
LTLNNLALLLHEEGDYVAARPLYERALAIWEKALGPDHPNVATVLNNLAFLLKVQGDYVAARPLYERALAIREKALGPDHPNVASTLHNLASLLQAEGEYTAARPLYERALTIYEKALGPDHPNVARTLHNLAGLLKVQGEYAAARPLFERALAIWEKALGPDHPNVASTLNNLAVLFQTEGEYAAARPLFVRALTIQKKARGLHHLDVAKSLVNLAHLDWQTGASEEARREFLQAVAIIHAHIERIFPFLSFAEQRNFLVRHLTLPTSYLLSAFRGGRGFATGYGFLFRWKGLLLESLRHQSVIARLARGNPAIEQRVAELQALRTKIAGWYHQAGEVPLAEWRKKNDALTEQKEVLERELARTLPPGALHDPMEGVNLNEFRRFLAPDEAFLDVYRYGFWEEGTFVEERYAVVVTGRQEGPR